MVVKAEVKEIQSDWVLLVYDIPATEKKARYKFLKQATSIGAIQHTESSYLLPFSEKASELANKLAEIGHAIVWKSHQPDIKKAKELTVKYEDHLKMRVAYIEQRLSISDDYIASGKLVIANRMGIKTGRLLKELADISDSYDPGWLKPKVEELVKAWKEIYGSKG